MTFEPVGNSDADNAMLDALLSASDALQLSRYKEFLTHNVESERLDILDQTMLEAIQRISGDRVRSLKVLHTNGQIQITGQATSYQSRQLVMDLVRSATEESEASEFSARIDIRVNGDHPDVVYAGCPAATLIGTLENSSHIEPQNILPVHFQDINAPHDRV